VVANVDVPLFSSSSSSSDTAASLTLPDAGRLPFVVPSRRVVLLRPSSRNYYWASALRTPKRRLLAAQRCDFITPVGRGGLSSPPGSPAAARPRSFPCCGTIRRCTPPPRSEERRAAELNFRDAPVLPQLPAPRAAPCTP